MEILDHIKKIRVTADKLIQDAQVIKSRSIEDKRPFVGESVLAIRSLQMGKSWLGKLMGEIGKSETPYPKSDTEKGIPPTQDVYSHGEFDIEKSRTLLELINDQRDAVEELIKEVANTTLPYSNATINRPYSIQHFTEAKFWYGFCLGIMRDEANKEQDQDQRADV